MFTFSLEVGPVHCDFENATCTGFGSENAPLVRYSGPDTLSVASPAVEMMLAVVEAVYVLATPGVKAPKEAGAPSDSDSVAGTVPVAPPGVLVSTTVTP